MQVLTTTNQTARWQYDTLAYVEKMFWIYKLSTFSPCYICFWDFHQNIKYKGIREGSKHFNEAKNLKIYFKHAHFQKTKNIHSACFDANNYEGREQSQGKRWPQSYFSECKLTFKSVDKAILYISNALLVFIKKKEEELTIKRKKIW